MKYTTFVEIIIQRIGQYVNDDTYQVPVIIMCHIKIKRPAHLSIVERLGGFSCVQR